MSDFPKTYLTVWPDNRAVPEATIRLWYDDAVANNEIDDVDAEDTDDMAMALHHAGIITLREKK